MFAQLLFFVNTHKLHLRFSLLRWLKIRHWCPETHSAKTSCVAPPTLNSLSACLCHLPPRHYKAWVSRDPISQIQTQTKGWPVTQFVGLMQDCLFCIESDSAALWLLWFETSFGTWMNVFYHKDQQHQVTMTASGPQMHLGYKYVWCRSCPVGVHVRASDVCVQTLFHQPNFPGIWFH